MKMFKSERLMLSHRAIHLERTIKCTVEGCECMFSTTIKLKSHINKCHILKNVMKKKEKRYMCGQCFKKFKTKMDLKSHQAAIHYGEKPYKCEHCDFEGAYKDTIKRHMNSVHLNIMFECIVPGCGRKTNEKGNMDKHMKSAHGIPLPNERKPKKGRIIIDDESTLPHVGRGLDH